MRLLGLRQADISFLNREIRVRVGLVRLRGAGPKLTEVKTKHSCRDLLLDDDMIAGLRAHQERQRFE